MQAVQPFHDGELDVQRTAGTRGVADELGVMISKTTSPFGRSFFEQLRFLVLATVREEQVWVSAAFGPLGFVLAPTTKELVVRLQGCLPCGDVSYDAFESGTPVGMLAIDFLHRRRYRTNGFVALNGADGKMLHLNVTEAFPNCPKYIQRREISAETRELPALVQTTTEKRTKLSESDKALVRASDTFFLGTVCVDTGADVNHRGGLPGFVQVVSDTELRWPDYRGNGLFQSFGNLAQDHRAALLFLDFSTGDLLQMSGHAEVLWGTDRHLAQAAERSVRFSIDSVRFTKGATNYRWNFIDYSMYNPVVPTTMQHKKLETDFPMTVHLVKIVEESPKIKTFRFLAPTYVRFAPGQYATFEFNSLKPEPSATLPLVRTWTLSEVANSATGDVTLEVSVKRKDGGVMSNWLHDHAKPGMTARLLGIGGEMTPFLSEVLGSSVKPSTSDKYLGENAGKLAGVPKQLLLISAGVGITPNVAIVRGIGARSDGTVNASLIPSIVIVHQDGSDEDLPFQRELTRRMRASNGMLRIVNVLSRPKNPRAASSTEENLLRIVGRVNKHVLLEQVSDVVERTIFLCGPLGFMRQVELALTEIGVAPQQIVTEEFNF